MAVLVGCETTNSINASSAVQKETWELAQMYHHTRVSRVAYSPESVAWLESELRDRGLTEEELEAARNGDLFIGMSRDAMYAVMGKPRRANRTVFEGSDRVQYVYGQYGPYVYTENGFVTAWQD